MLQFISLNTYIPITTNVSTPHYLSPLSCTNHHIAEVCRTCYWYALPSHSKLFFISCERLITQSYHEGLVTMGISIIKIRTFFSYPLFPLSLTSLLIPKCLIIHPTLSLTHSSLSFTHSPYSLTHSFLYFCHYSLPTPFFIPHSLTQSSLWHSLQFTYSLFSLPHSFFHHFFHLLSLLSPHSFFHHFSHFLTHYSLPTPSPHSLTQSPLSLTFLWVTLLRNWVTCFPISHGMQTQQGSQTVK